MDEYGKVSKVNRIAKSLEPLILVDNKKAQYFGKDKEYFETIGEYFTDIDSEKYNVLLFSCACYILYNMKISDPSFVFNKSRFLELLPELYPLFSSSYDKNQINYGIFRFICFILIQKNYNIASIN